MTSIPMPARRNREICASSNRRINPHYKAKNDTLEFNADYAVTPALTFTSQTGFNHDFLWSTEDYNRFNTRAGHFHYLPAAGRESSRRSTRSRAPAQTVSRRRGDILRSATGLQRPARRGGSFGRTCLAVEPGIPAGLEFQRPAQFQRRRQLSALRDRRKLLRLHQYADALTQRTGGAGNGAAIAPWVPGVSDNQPMPDQAAS